jgi:hypothetical protein
MNKSIRSGIMLILSGALASGAATLSGTVRVATGGGAQGAPIADATVILSSVGGGGGQALDTATTNAQGQYTFANITTGFRTVVASKAGYNDGAAFANVAQANGEYTANITMSATGGGGGGETGTVSGTVRAAAANGQGALIEGALLVLSRAAGGGAAAFIDSTRTNAQGQYRFDSVPAVNNFTMLVRAAGYNNATNNNIDVDAGDTTTANFSLTAVPGPARPGSISGTVRNAADNAVVAGATVVLSRSGIGGGRVDSAKTDADGRYAFDSVAANTNYVVTVTAAGFQTAVNSDVDVVANQTATVDFRLVASGPITTRGSIIGTVTDNLKKPVAKARVILSRSGVGGGSGAVDTVETDASGDFAFDSVAALQNYTVTVSAAGFQTATNNNVDVVAGQAVVADFFLVPSVGVLRDGAFASAFRLSDAKGSLSVEFAASPWAGRLSAYDLRGALAFSGSVPAGATAATLPGKAGIRFLVLERGSLSERLAVQPAR